MFLKYIVSGESMCKISKFTFFFETQNSNESDKELNIEKLLKAGPESKSHGIFFISRTQFVDISFIISRPMWHFLTNKGSNK